MFALGIYYGRKAHQECSGVEVKESKLIMVVRSGFGLGYIEAMTVYATHLFTWTDIFLPNLDRWIGVLASMSSILLLWWVQSALDVTFNMNLHGISGGDG